MNSNHENEGVLSAIGGTPLVPLKRILDDMPFQVFAKLEGANPGGSVKDRAALQIIRQALDTGRIRPGGVVIESSSGNMAVGLAQVCAYYGLRFICVLDPKTTSQNLRILSAYGAEIEIVQQPDPITGEFLPARIDRVRKLAETIPGSYWTNQYANAANAEAHRRTTMSEIVDATLGDVDYLFCATSTCGTITGCAQAIQDLRLRTRVIAVDAIGSVIFGGERSKRLIPGHGAAFRPDLCQPQLVDRCVYVSDLECVIGCRTLVRREAILAGGSSGAIVAALAKIREEIPSDATCVLILPDRGERYLETIYADDWVRSHFGSAELEFPHCSRAATAN